MLTNCKLDSIQKKRNCFILSLFYALFLSASALTQAATYYVSEQGNDSNPGTLSSPWRNINYAASQANPGDTVYVRGGTYYEEIRTYRSGTAANRITFKAYSGETPIVDGTAQVTGWQQCTSAADFVDHDGNPIAGRYPGNANYKNIYKAVIPATDVGYGTDIHVFENGTYLMRSGLPKQLPENYIYDNIDQYQDVDPSCFGQSNYIIDKNRNEPDGFWVGASVSVYLYNNNHHVATSKVVGWSQAEHKLTLSPALPATLTSGGTIPDCYKLENHWGCLTQLGEVYHTTNAKNNTYTVYIWPRSTADLSSSIRVSKYDRGFEFVNNYDDYITVDGFTFRGFTSGPNSGTHGSFGVGNISAYPHTGAEIKNCKILNCAGTAAITMWCGTNDVYENNVVDGCRSGYGIACRGLSTTTPTQGCKIRGNTINHIRSTSIKIIYSNNIEITHNKVGKSGSHGNACSLYMNNNNVLYADNITTESNSGLTMQDSSNIYIIGNILHATADNVCVAWPNSKDTMRGDVFVLGNTIQRGDEKGTGGGLGFSTSGTQAKYVVINNIIDGAMYAEDVLDVTHHHNLYTDYSWKQSSKYGWSLAAGEIYNDNYTAVFNDPANYDFTIKSGSPADNKGTDISAYLPTDKFPDFDFSVDLYGTPRGTPSLGACEGGSSSSDPVKIDPPVANAGSDQTVAYADRNTIQLNGSQSSGYGTLTYTWTIDGDLVKTGVSPVISLEPGTYTVVLTVKDGQTPSVTASDSMVIVVEAEKTDTGNLTLRDGLAAEWKFNENAGVIAGDSSDNANPATLSDNTMWDQTGGVNFTSSQTYLTCRADASLNLTGSLTLSAWINPRSYGEGNYGRIIDKGDGSSGRGFSLMLNGTNGNVGYMTYGGTYVSSDNNVVELNTWTHVCVTYDKQAQTVTFYLNGQAAGSSAYTQSPADSSNDPLYIGVRGYDKQRNFDGTMDNVCLYNRALNETEVKLLYAVASGNGDDGLTALWRLDDFSGSLAKDASVNGNNGTLLDNPEWGLPWKGCQDECLYFNGSTQAMQISTGTLTAESGTIILKTKPFSTTGIRFLFGHVNNATNKNLIWLYTVSGKLALGMGNSSILSTGIDTLSTGTMYQIALAWDGTNYFVYVDGQLMGTGPYSGLTALAATADVANMGTAFHRTYGLGFDGIVDDVRTYDHSLSAQEIAALANLQEIKENKTLNFYVSGVDTDGNPCTYTAKSLPDGAVFDTASQKLSWRPSYGQAGNYQILFASQDGTEQQTVKVSVQDVSTRDWYHNFLSRNGKL